MRDYIKLKGGRPLVGEVALKGGKNVVPKAIVATLLTDEPCTLYDVPKVEDVDLMVALLRRIGSTIEEVRPGILRIDNSRVRPLTHKDLEDITGRSRIPILLIGPLLNRFGQAVLPKLGGCKIGPRPIDQHVLGLKTLGAELSIDQEGYETFRTERLKGGKIVLSYPSIGATEQILLASVLSEGETEISNAAIEPEIVDLIALLQKMGAIICVDTDRTIKIEGVRKLSGYKHNPLPDRNEAVSWAAAALSTNGEIFVRNANQKELTTFLNIYRKIGGGFDVTYDGITFYRQGDKIKPVTVVTDVHPGFQTDWQQPLSVVLTQAEGVSMIGESVYERRFAFTESLITMGARIDVVDGPTAEVNSLASRRPAFQTAIITGPSDLRGAKIDVPDLRAGFTYVIAALTARGVSTITSFSVLGRGYENIVAKLQTLGAEIVEIKAP